MEMIEGEPPKAVLFDLDGTLYELEPVRRRMGRALAINALLSPLKGPRTIKVLKAFRAIREDLRAIGDGSPCLDDAQYAEPARQLGLEPDVVRAAVEDWMLERPLPHLFSAGRTALRPILAALKGWDLPIGVFSDYPADAKLAALGVDDMVDVTVCATESEVNAFKPHPRGFLVAAERMGVTPEEVVYVGDRVEVDAAGAAAAGMRCLIVGAPERSAPRRRGDVRGDPERAGAGLTPPGPSRLSARPRGGDASLVMARPGASARASVPRWGTPRGHACRHGPKMAAPRHLARSETVHEVALLIQEPGSRRRAPRRGRGRDR